MKYIIGLDIGATKINGIVFNGQKAVKELTVVTPKNVLDFQRSLLKLVDFLSVGKKINGVGIGMAGLVNVAQGVVVHSPNIKFVKNLNLVKLLPGKKVKIDNDAKCFTRAEAVLGQGKAAATVVGVTLGTGIGGGLASEGKIYRGVNFAAGEMGYMMYEHGQTFEEAFQKARDSHNNPLLAKIVGTLLTNIYRVVDPEVIVIGGGVALDKKRNFLQQAKTICGKNLASYKISTNNIKISKLKNAGSIGAALLF